MTPELPDPPEGTWRVVDADGNVVQSGETIHLVMAASMGEEEANDGGDRSG